MLCIHFQKLYTCTECLVATNMIINLNRFVGEELVEKMKFIIENQKIISDPERTFCPRPNCHTVCRIGDWLKVLSNNGHGVLGPVPNTSSIKDLRKESLWTFSGTDQHVFGCSVMQKHAKKWTFLTCPKCKINFCSKCLEVWHPGN